MLFRTGCDRNANIFWREVVSQNSRRGDRHVCNAALGSTTAQQDTPKGRRMHEGKGSLEIETSPAELVQCGQTSNTIRRYATSNETERRTHSTGTRNVRRSQGTFSLQVSFDKMGPSSLTARDRPVHLRDMNGTETLHAHTIDDTRSRGTRPSPILSVCRRVDVPI